MAARYNETALMSRGKAVWTFLLMISGAVRGKGGGGVGDKRQKAASEVGWESVVGRGGGGGGGGRGQEGT